MKKRIRRGSIKHKILCLLYHAPLLPRKQFHFTLTSIPQRNNDMLRDLVSLGFVGMTEFNRRRCCYLTEAGLKELYRLYNIEAWGDSVRIPYHRAKKERNLRVGQTVNLMQAGGVNAFEFTKPHFETTIAVLTGTRQFEVQDNWKHLRPSADGLDDIAKLLRQGLFYPSSVVKKALKRRGIVEPTKSSRFVGILLMEEDIYFCYNTLNRMMLFENASERPSIQSILDLLSGYPPYGKYSDLVERSLPGAIVMSASMEMLPALATGYKGGVNQSPKQLKFRGTYHFLSGKTNLFETILFFTPDALSIQKVGMLRLASSCRLDAQLEAFFSRFNGFVYTGSSQYKQAYHEPSGMNAVCLVFYDLVQLQSLRKQDKQLIVFLPKGHEEYVSRILGPLLYAVYDFDGSPLYPGKYSILGEKMDAAA